jgi:hypothetical protein
MIQMREMGAVAVRGNESRCPKSIPLMPQIITFDDDVASKRGLEKRWERVREW